MGCARAARTAQLSDLLPFTFLKAHKGRQQGADASNLLWWLKGCSQQASPLQKWPEETVLTGTRVC